MRHQFRVYQHCPVPKNLAPYIKVVCDDAKVGCNSIYRGQDAERLLNKYGKASQRQLYLGYIRGLPGYLPANPPGFSTHEQKSDGVAYPRVRRGRDLAWWQIGFDVDNRYVQACKRAARRHNWQLFQPYSSGTEYHHLNFRVEPKPHSRRMAIRIRWLRATMGRS